MGARKKTFWAKWQSMWEQNCTIFESNEQHHTTVIQFAHILFFSVFYKWLTHENNENITQTFYIWYTIKYAHVSINYSFIDLNIHLRQVNVCFVTFWLRWECFCSLSVCLPPFWYLVIWFIIISDDLASLSSVVVFVFTRKVCTWIHKYKHHFHIKPLY